MAFYRTVLYKIDLSVHELKERIKDYYVKRNIGTILNKDFLSLISLNLPRQNLLSQEILKHFGTSEEAGNEFSKNIKEQVQV